MPRPKDTKSVMNNEHAYLICGELRMLSISG